MAMRGLPGLTADQRRGGVLLFLPCPGLFFLAMADCAMADRGIMQRRASQRDMAMPSCQDCSRCDRAELVFRGSKLSSIATDGSIAPSFRWMSADTGGEEGEIAIGDTDGSAGRAPQTIICMLNCSARDRQFE